MYTTSLFPVRATMHELEFFSKPNTSSFLNPSLAVLVVPHCFTVPVFKFSLGGNLWGNILRSYLMYSVYLPVWQWSFRILPLVHQQLQQQTGRMAEPHRQTAMWWWTPLTAGSLARSFRPFRRSFQPPTAVCWWPSAGARHPPLQRTPPASSSRRWNSLPAVHRHHYH